MATTIKGRAKLHNPAHPGEVLRELYMKPLDISVKQVAEAIDISRKHVSMIINGHAPVSAEIALRLAEAFGTDAELWINMQAQHDLWLLSKRARRKVKVLVERKAA